MAGQVAPSRSEAIASRVPFVLAVAFTLVWAAFVALYLSQFTWARFIGLAPAELGVLLAAAGGPPAALWLCMVVLEQRRETAVVLRRFAELASHERATLANAESLARSLQEIQADAARSRSAETRRLALEDLAASAAVMAARLGVIGRDAAPAAWARFGAGDFTVFVQSFLNFAGTHPDIAERMAEAAERDPVARAALAGFVRRYDQLLASVRDDKLLTSIFDDGALGRGYRLFKTADQLLAVEPSPVSHAPQAEAAGEDDMLAELNGLSRRLEAVAPEVS